ncbi:phage holin family protein [Emticicia fluvialis]|uniref:phage holin family protein n=1 Tax=Emticicia fluvialis TaxID=2974474 RepID=UPI0021652728|nr:phage holin family protein [Emticicia fluvialis]
MEIYNDIKEKTEDVFDDLSNHLEARWNLGVLNTVEKVADGISTAASAIVLGVTATFALFFISLGVAWLIGQSLNNLAFGLFIVAGVYVIAGIIIYLQRDNLIKIPVINSIIQKFYYED